VVVDQEPIGKGLTPSVVDIRTKDGKVYSKGWEILRIVNSISSKAGDG